METLKCKSYLSLKFQCTYIQFILCLKHWILLSLKCLLADTVMQSYIYINLDFLLFNVSVLFSSPEPKAQVSFSDQNLSIVVVVNFSHFHLLLLNHWANINQTWHKHESILRWRRFKFVQMKDPLFSKGR